MERSQLITKTFDSYDALKAECKRLGLTDSALYRRYYRKYGLPAHPERIFQEWVSYRDFFDLVDFIPYQQLKELIVPLKLKNAKEYRKFIIDSQDRSFPLDPQTVYSDEWENWYLFLGKEEPLKPSFIPKEYSAWAEAINRFMIRAKGGGSKETLLCRFVRLFIIPFDHSKSPHEFLTQSKFDLKPFRGLIETLPTARMKRAIVVSVNEFLDYIIDMDLTEEDEETGIIARIANARNPCSLLLTQQEPISANTRSETTKPCLPYHFVKKAQEWIIPLQARTFLDLNHLQRFDADWVKVEASLVDPSDPDCVYRVNDDGQVMLWTPIDWIHTYALTKLPLRGRQIAYNDSGEADEYLADIDSNGKLIWVKNQSPWAGLTKNQSFILRMNGGQIGTFTTTNKTSINGEGYSIPWMPEELAYWLVRLRRWQQKYNPISKPSSWTQCKRTNMNLLQLKSRGINCFLFRRMGDLEPGFVTNALTPRLAAALYNIQPSNLKLAESNGNLASLSNYSSRYTPHAMRVSLITAYVLEMGMPIEIVMKIVGHSSIIMSIYYCKVSNSEIRKRLNEGEKLALKSEISSVQEVIEQNKIESLKNQLIGNNDELFRSLTNDVPSGNYVFRDYGICPFAASRCDDGGPQVQTSNFNSPTPNGYLGSQNCLRCRHFITGPAFLGGLLAITNEVLLESNIQSESCTKLQVDINEITEKLNRLDEEEYVANVMHQEFTKTQERLLNETALRNIEAEYETAAKKLDMLLCDIQCAYSLITRCQSLMAAEKDDQLNDKLSLIATSEAEVVIEIEEVSHFQQLQEVCSNAIIYKSCSADRAIYPRSQLLDKMSAFNDMAPRMFFLTKEQQLCAGNEIYKLLLSRLKSWERITDVVNCKVKFKELGHSEQITTADIELVLSNTNGLIMG